MSKRTRVISDDEDCYILNKERSSKSINSISESAFLRDQKAPVISQNNDLHEQISLSDCSISSELKMKSSRKRKLYEIASMSDKDCDFIE